MMSRQRYSASQLEVGDDKIPDMPTNLEHLFDTGQWSDLEIKTATHTFNVHKSIVCSAFPFVQAACFGGWKETQTGVIELPEPEYIVGALLAYCYGLFNFGEYEDDAGTDIVRYLELFVAADKYGLLGIKAAIDRHLRRWLFCMEWENITTIALWIYEADRRQVFGPGLTREVVRQVVRELKWITDGDDWPRIHSCPQLALDVVRFIAQRSTAVTASRDIMHDEHLCIDPDDAYCSE